MALAQMYRSQGGPFRGDRRSSFSRHHHSAVTSTASTTNSSYNAPDYYVRNYDNSYDFSRNFGEYNYYSELVHPTKRRKSSTSSWEDSRKPYIQPRICNSGLPTNSSSMVLPGGTRADAIAYPPPTCKRDRSTFEGEDVVFMSKDEIERCSPSRKDGIDAMHETRLRYSYCNFLQNLGIQLELPQTTIGTAMVLCHRFFVRRSHACHDRFLISTAALFLAAKSEETACPLNNVVRASCEILHNQDFTSLSYRLPVDWFEKYRERVIEAEQMILTTLNFELNVQHPYAPLTSILDKLGLSQSVLVNLALSLVSEGAWTVKIYFLRGCLPIGNFNIDELRKMVKERASGRALSSRMGPSPYTQHTHRAETYTHGDGCGSSQQEFSAILLELPHATDMLVLVNNTSLRSSLWLQFKPHHIAAGAAYLAAKSINMDLTSSQHIWKEFQTPPSILKDVVQQLVELF